MRKLPLRKGQQLDKVYKSHKGELSFELKAVYLKVCPLIHQDGLSPVWSQSSAGRVYHMMFCCHTASPFPLCFAPGCIVQRLSGCSGNPLAWKAKWFVIQPFTAEMYALRPQIY